jgi:hypothetical protein
MNQQEGYQRIDAWHRARKATETTAPKATNGPRCTRRADPSRGCAHRPAAALYPRAQCYIKQINNRIDRAIARTDHPGKP